MQQEKLERILDAEQQMKMLDAEQQMKILDAEQQMKMLNTSFDYPLDNVILRPEQTWKSQGLKAVLIICAMYNAACSVGYANSLAVLYYEIVTYFQVSKDIATLGPGLCTAISEGAGMVCTAMVNKIGTRYTMLIGGILEMLGLLISSFVTNPLHLIGSLGVLTGFGACLSYVSIFIAIGQHFENVRIPNALVSVGFTCGIFGFSQMMQTLTSIYTWRGSLLIISGVLFNICLASMILTNDHKTEKPILVEKNLLPNKLFDISIFTNFMFLYYVLVTCFVYSSLLIFVTFMVDYAAEKNISEEDGAHMLLMYGLGSIPGGFVAMGIMSCNRFRAWDLQAISVVISGIALAIFPFFSSVESLFGASSLLGIAIGIITAVYTTVALETLGSEKYSSGLGFTGTAMGILMFVVSYTSGSITESVGSYGPAFMIFGWTTCGLGVGMILLGAGDALRKFLKRSLN